MGKVQLIENMVYLRPDRFQQDSSWNVVIETKAKTILEFLILCGIKTDTSSLAVLTQ